MVVNSLYSDQLAYILRFHFAGDAGQITVGSNSNVQDGVLVRSLRAAPGSRSLGTTIGENVTIGHSAVLHGVTVEDEAFIGIGAVLQEGVKASLFLKTFQHCQSTFAAMYSALARKAGNLLILHLFYW